MKEICFALAIVSVALVTGCAMFQEKSESALVGTWTNPIGTVWAIKADGTFEVSLSQGHHVDVFGKYSATNDTLNIEESHGLRQPKSCRSPAAYKFSRNGDTLTFTKVNDKCKLREKNMLAGWKTWKAE